MGIGWKLDREAGVGMLRYEIAEVVNPHVHIVAKVSKAVLATLR